MARSRVAVAKRRWALVAERPLSQLRESVSYGLEYAKKGIMAKSDTDSAE